MAVRSWLVENYNSDAGNGGPGPQITVVGGMEGFAGMQAPDRTLQGVMVDVYGTAEAQQIFDQSRRHSPVGRVPSSRSDVTSPSCRTSRSRCTTEGRSVARPAGGAVCVALRCTPLYPPVLK